jgi:hypothetical protein
LLLAAGWVPRPDAAKALGVILLTNPGGGSGLFGITTSGPIYGYARRWRILAAPLSVTRAVPYTTRHSSKSHSFLVVDGPAVLIDRDHMRDGVALEEISSHLRKGDS